MALFVIRDLYGVLLGLACWENRVPAIMNGCPLLLMLGIHCSKLAARKQLDPDFAVCALVRDEASNLGAERGDLTIQVMKNGGPAS